MSVQYIKIYYGPCDSFHTVIHKPQKLRGLRDCLQKLGYRVDLMPVEFVNYCVLEICGHELFRCNIQNLHFNTPCHLDPVCQRAINAVLEATIKFRRARNYLWFWTLIEDQIFVRNKYMPKDQWPFHWDSKSYTTCVECANCCGILTNWKKDD